MFKDRDVICFLGDSITAACGWTAEVHQALKKKYKIKAYNCGVPGGRAKRAAKYLHSRCLVYNPDYVTVCFGINDIYREAYPLGDKERISKGLQETKIALTSIVKDIIASGATPILCVPSPYDEVSEVEAENLHCQCGLDEVEKIVRALAEEYSCPLVDFKKEFQPLLGERELINPDRVHPNLDGHHIMAQSFLRDIGEIDECDFDTPFVMEDWNRKVQEAFGKISAMNFVEYCALFDEFYDKNLTYAEKKEIVKEYLSRHEDKTGFIPRAYADYIEHIDIYDRLVGEIVKVTTF